MGKQVKFVETVQTVVRNDGFFSLYRGALSAGIGSIIFRASGFSAFELFFTRWEHTPFMRNTIPLTGGLELRTVGAGIMSGSFRAILECPFEYAKVKR
jgi:hypothetical protein